MNKIFIVAMSFFIASCNLLKLPPKDYCSKISSTTDIYTGEIKTQSPYNRIFFIKTNNKGYISYYMGLGSLGASAVVNGKGINIIFSDGSKMNFPDEKINASISGNQYKPFSYTALVRITDEQLKEISNKLITDFRLYIFDTTLKPKESEKYKAYATCIL